MAGPSLTPLRDFASRGPCPPPLRASIDRAFAGASGESTPDVQALAQECLAATEAEIAVRTRQKYSVGDPNAARQKLLGEPRRQADNALSALKQKIAGERSEWSRRAAGQAATVLDDLEKNLRDAPVRRTEAPGSVTVELEHDWQVRFQAWLDDALRRWARHTQEILPTKTRSAIEIELRAVQAALRERVDPLVPDATELPTESGRPEAPPVTQTCEIPTIMAAFLDAFKSGLNFIAMFAGFLIIPVVGYFSQEQPVTLRALIMSGVVLPLLLGAVWQTGKQRSRLREREVEKAATGLRNRMQSYGKTRVDRFKGDVERSAASYVAVAQAELVAQVQALIDLDFAERERGITTELARVHVEADRINDQLQILKQLRSSLLNLTTELERAAAP